MKNHLVCLSVIALFSSGCALDLSAADQEQSASAEPQVFITDVTMNADGTTSVRELTWSRLQLHAAIRERIRAAAAQGVVIDPAEVGVTMDEPAAPQDGAEEVGEAAAAISVDSGCARSSLWITDNASFGDLSHMICYAGSGVASLPASWAGAYYGGTHTPTGLWGPTGLPGGDLYYVSPGCDAGCRFHYGRNQQVNPIASAGYLYATTQWVVDQYPIRGL